MNLKKINWNTIIKSIYAIEGELDELGLKRIGELSSRVLIVQQAYLLLSSVAMLILTYHHKEGAFYHLIWGQLLLLFIGFSYINYHLQKEEINTLEISPENFEAFKKRRLKRCFLETLIFFMLIHFTTGLYPWHKNAYFDYITSVSNIFNNLLYSFVHWRILVKLTKKRLKQLPQDQED